MCIAYLHEVLAFGRLQKAKHEPCADAKRGDGLALSISPYLCLFLPTKITLGKDCRDLGLRCMHHASRPGTVCETVTAEHQMRNMVLWERHLLPSFDLLCGTVVPSNPWQ